MLLSLSYYSLFQEMALKHINPLAYTAIHETAGLASSINTQPAVRRSEPSMSFAFNSSLVSRWHDMSFTIWNLMKRSFKTHF